MKTAPAIVQEGGAAAEQRSFTGQGQLCPTSIGDDNAEGSKHFSTLRANLALRGYRLHELSDGYLIARWNLSKHAPDLRAVGMFLRQIGGAA